MATKIASAITFTTTSTAFKVALSRVPAMSMPATTNTMPTAGRLISPPACGPAVAHNGRSTPRPFRKPTT